MPDCTVRELLEDFPCPCGGKIRITELEAPPIPGAAPIVVMHTMPYCQVFKDLDADDFVKYLLGLVPS